MAQVTSPIILDSTGQQIHSDLQQIKAVLTTPSAAEDITFDNTGTGMQADDVQDAITELKSNLTELGTVCDLLANHGNTTSHSTVTLPAGKKFSDYKFLLFYMSTSGGNIRNSAGQFIPRALWGNPITTLSIPYPNSNTHIFGTCVYVSDTQIELYMSDQYRNVYVYGVK